MSWRRKHASGLTGVTTWEGLRTWPPLADGEIRLDRLRRHAVYGQDVLRASREHDHQVHPGDQPHMPAGHGLGWCGELQRAVSRPRDVHEQVERTRHFGWRQAERCHGGEEIVRAVVVMALHTKEGVAPTVAGGDQGVMHAA